MQVEKKIDKKNRKITLIGKLNFVSKIFDLKRKIPKKQKMIEPVDGPRPKKYVLDARKRVLDVAKEMEKEGKLSIEDLTGGEMIE